jgi:hypothetical protein
MLGYWQPASVPAALLTKIPYSAGAYNLYCIPAPHAFRGKLKMITDKLKFYYSSF